MKWYKNIYFDVSLVCGKGMLFDMGVEIQLVEVGEFLMFLCV